MCSARRSAPICWPSFSRPNTTPACREHQPQRYRDGSGLRTWRLVVVVSLRLLVQRIADRPRAGLRLDLRPGDRRLHLHRPGLAGAARTAGARPGTDRRVGPRRGRRTRRPGRASPGRRAGPEVDHGRRRPAGRTRPWLVRAGVRAFHIGAAARPLGSNKAYVDPDLVRTWRTLIDDAVRRGPRRDRLHRRADLARSRPVLVAPGQRRLVRRTARLRRGPRTASPRLRAGPLRRGRGTLRIGDHRRRGAGHFPGDRRPADRGRSPSPKGLPAGGSRLTRSGRLRAQRTRRPQRPGRRPRPTLAGRIGGPWRMVPTPFQGESHMTACVHLAAAPLTPPPADFEPFCEDCALDGGEWLHLRRCLECQHIACCDSSPGRHASAHSRATGHPVITSAEPGEHWRWCFVDEVGA